MNKKHIWMLVLVGFILIQSSCDKYLDVQPKGVQTLNTVSDYDQWLNSTALQASLPNDYGYLEDNTDIPTTPNPPTNLVYVWSSQFSADLASSPIFWATHYRNIYYFNTVLQNIDKIEGAESDKRRLKAESLLGRAFDYLYLVNLYGKVYNNATADHDLSVPFVISNDLAVETPPRSTVKQVYDHIIDDIKTAIPNLPVDNSLNRYRGSVAAAYSILARTYLYMGNFTEAMKYANLALQKGPNVILDFNKMANAGSQGILAIRADVIYGRLGASSTGANFVPALSFLKSFDKTDIRLKFYYTNLGDYSFNTRGTTRFNMFGTVGLGGTTATSNWGTSVVEMRLIIAEAAARANDISTALTQLDLVRKCRIPTAGYQAFQSGDQAVVLQKIIDERGLEFAFIGMRWFDMRRLDAENKMLTINRYDAKNNVIATLEPHGARYTLQIPIQVISFNSEMPQNP